MSIGSGVFRFATARIGSSASGGSLNDARKNATPRATLVTPGLSNSLRALTWRVSPLISTRP